MDEGQKHLKFCVREGDRGHRRHRVAEGFGGMLGLEDLGAYPSGVTGLCDRGKRRSKGRFGGVMAAPAAMAKDFVSGLDGKRGKLLVEEVVLSDRIGGREAELGLQRDRVVGEEGTLRLKETEVGETALGRELGVKDVFLGFRPEGGALEGLFVDQGHRVRTLIGPKVGGFGVGSEERGGRGERETAEKTPVVHLPEAEKGALDVRQGEEEGALVVPDRGRKEVG